MNPDYDPSKPHHTPEGFRDPDEPAAHKSFRDVLAWKRQARKEGLPRAANAPTPMVAPRPRPPSLATRRC